MEAPGRCAVPNDCRCCCGSLGGSRCGGAGCMPWPSKIAYHQRRVTEASRPAAGRTGADPQRWRALDAARWGRADAIRSSSVSSKSSYSAAAVVWLSGPPPADQAAKPTASMSDGGRASMKPPKPSPAAAGAAPRPVAVPALVAAEAAPRPPAAWGRPSAPRGASGCSANDVHASCGPVGGAQRTACGVLIRINIRRSSGKASLGGRREHDSRWTSDERTISQSSLLSPVPAQADSVATMASLEPFGLVSSTCRQRRGYPGRQPQQAGLAAVL